MFTFIAFHRQVRQVGHVCNVSDPVYVQNKIILLASRLNSVLTITQPLLKKPSVDNKIYNNFWPVSNLKMISKMTEKIAVTQLNHYLEVNSLSELYKINHSCDTFLLCVQYSVCSGQ